MPTTNCVCCLSSPLPFFCLGQAETPLDQLPACVGSINLRKKQAAVSLERLKYNTPTPWSFEVRGVEVEAEVSPDLYP